MGDCGTSKDVSMDPDPSAALILAAGAARRFGGPKLAEPIEGESLLRRTVGVAFAAGLAPVVVVLGAHRDVLEPELVGLPVEVVFNPRWEEGMGTSLAAAVGHLLEEHPETLGGIVIPADLPGLEPSHLRRLEAVARRSGLPAAATVWKGAPPQAPAWLARLLFRELLDLTADRGARDLLRSDPSRVALVSLNGPLLDVDQPEDLPDRLA